MSVGHMTDKYKLPGHITFSDESLYHGKDGELGGEWRKNAEDKWTFTPGPSNYKNYSVQQMQDYFQKYEPDATLVLPPGIGGHFQNIDEKPPEKWTQPLSWGEFWNAVQSDSEIYNSVKRGLTAPGRALGGQEPTIADAVDMAGVVATGAVVPRPTNSLGLFGGRFAKEAEDLAVKMEGKGFKDVAIKKMTGLERGADGAWRNEIDDSKSVYKPENFQGGFAYTHEILDHPELYKNYPELKDVGVFEVNQVGDSPNNHGMFNPDQGHIQIKKGLPPEEAHATLIHEIQHYIQHKEGFAMGVPEQIPVELADKFKGYLLRTYAKEPIEEILAMAESGSVDKAREEAKKLLSDIDYLTYRSISSEQEAFNAQNRLKLSARARAENPGKYTEGMARSEQLVVEPTGTQAGSPYAQRISDNQGSNLEKIMGLTSELAPNGLDWKDWRRSENIDQAGPFKEYKDMSIQEISKHLRESKEGEKLLADYLDKRKNNPTAPTELSNQLGHSDMENAFHKNDRYFYAKAYGDSSDLTPTDKEHYQTLVKKPYKDFTAKDYDFIRQYDAERITGLMDELQRRMEKLPKREK
jgi:hypothetical protein